jgi:anti-sigma B factor antagonist
VPYRIADRQLDDDLVVIELAGEADLMAAPDLRRHVDRAISRGANRLILDLSETTFIDSTTLGILVSTLKRLRPRDGRVAVQCPDPSIRRVFALTGVGRMLPVTGTRDEALASLAQSERAAAHDRSASNSTHRGSRVPRPLRRSKPPIPEL